MEITTVNRGKNENLCIDIFPMAEHDVAAFDYSVDYHLPNVDEAFNRQGKVHNCRDMIEALLVVRQSLPHDARITLFHAALSD